MGGQVSVDSSNSDSSTNAIKVPALTRDLQHKQNIILFARAGRDGQGSPLLYGVSFIGGTNWLHVYGPDTLVVDEYSILQVDKDPQDPASLRLWCPAISGSACWLASDSKSQLFFTTKESEETVWRMGGMSMKAASLVNVRKGGPSFMIRVQPILHSWYDRVGLLWEPKDLAPYYLAPTALQGLCPVFERRLVHSARQQRKAAKEGPDGSVQIGGQATQTVRRLKD
ncbi:hypothetical protein KFL_000250390 [Klebsormidium nitens]|uniref:Uncharacterized protein n=1 Tax=Klebsormidium nitens TaxID=105231 RepID=A0A1Y1HN64_KLENI|nr:hypothetical protein KFL_000250390 [Klebsormidium nitens]|eukprot:GAQ79162.1 hypothetical protein KFL_000250390 [Klebsormidium nitens]